MAAIEAAVGGRAGVSNVDAWVRVEPDRSLPVRLLLPKGAGVYGLLASTRADISTHKKAAVTSHSGFFPKNSLAQAHLQCL
jgi:hypothetical protein